MTTDRDASTSQVIVEEEREGYLAATPSEILYDAILQFSAEVQSLRSAYGNVGGFLRSAYAGSVKRGNEYLETNGELVPGSEPRQYRFTHPAHHTMYQPLARIIRQISDAQELVPQALLISLLARFEALVGSILDVVAMSSPDALLPADTQISLKEILEYETVEELRLDLIAREVDEIARTSTYHFVKFLRNRLKIEFDFASSWPRFVEVSERRNCHAHNNGRVSKQYISNTGEAGYKHTRALQPGDFLPLSEQYFQQGALVVLEVGLKIALNVWKAIGSQEDTSKMARLVHELTVRSIQSDDMEFARQLAQFGLDSLFKEGPEADRKLLLLNVAQTHKWQGNEGSMAEVLASVDWTAASGTYLFAIAVLRENYGEAARRMQTVCGDETDQLPADALLDWPIFRKFRESTEFLEAFEQVYGYSPLIEAVTEPGANPNELQGAPDPTDTAD